MLSRFPYPLEKGDKLRAYYQLAGLSKDYEIHLFCTSDSAVSDSDLARVKPYCSQVTIYRLRKGLIFLNLLKAFLTGKPFQVAYFYQRRAFRHMQRALEELRPDHIFCQLVRAAEYVKDYHACPKTIDLMDALSKGMERRSGDVAVPLKWIFREEAARLKRYEGKILDYFEKACIISEQDRRYIIHPKNSSIVIIPNGVGEHFFEYPETPPKTTDLIFTGNMSYAPNVQACLFIARELLPGLKKHDPGIRIDLVGATPAAAVKSLAGPNIRVTGWVDDMRPNYAAAHIFIAPMLSGTGMQNKILEAMAMGLPCITTRLANNAILARENEQIILAETAEEMLEAIRKLKSDPDLYARLSRNAKNFVASNYNWKAMNAKLIGLIGN